MRTHVGVGVVASIGLCIAAAYFLTGPTAPSSGPSADSAGGPPSSCTFESGSTMAYALSSEVSTPGHSEADMFSAVVSERVVSTGEDQATLQVALSQVDLRQGLAQPQDRIEQSLGDTFEIDVSSSCRIVEFRFPEEWSDASRRLVAGALRTHEHVLESDETWEVDQTDAVGRYQAAYTRDGDGITRRKVLYYDDNGLEAFGMKIVIPYASANVTFDDDGIASSQARERLQIRVNGEIRADLEQRSSFVRDGSKYRAPAAAQRLASGDPFAIQQAATTALPQAPADLAEARVQYDALAAALDPFSMTNGWMLAGLIAAHPSLADDLVARLEGDELSEAARSSIFWVLEQAATEHTIAQLTTLVDAPRREDRARAAIALSRSGTPTSQVSERLLKMYREDTDPDAAATGLLALGVVGATGDDEARSVAREGIGAAFEDAQTRGETMAALGAMGNAGDPEFMPQLAESLYDDDPSVRGKAADAMRGLGDEARPHLRAALETEVDPTAATTVAATLRVLGPPSSDDLGWAAQQIEVAPSTGVRGELIAWLGEDLTPESTAILAERFHNEPSSQVRQQIGRYLPASELR